MYWTKDLAAQLRELRKPLKFDFTLDVVEHPTCVELRCYEAEIMSLSESNRMQFIDFLAKAQKLVQSAGIKCIVGGDKGESPRSGRR